MSPKVTAAVHAYQQALAAHEDAALRSDAARRVLHDAEQALFRAKHSTEDALKALNMAIWDETHPAPEPESQPESQARGAAEAS